jgi:hypothetical protein
LLLKVEFSLDRRSARPARASWPLYSRPDLSPGASDSVPFRAMEGNVVPGWSGLVPTSL